MSKVQTSDRLKYILETRPIKQVDILNLCKPYCEKYSVKITKSQLSEYIAGKTVPKADKISILAMALNVSEAWLMGYNYVNESAGAARSTPEEHLLNSFHSLNYDGQELAIDYVDALAEKPKYQRTDEE